MFARVDPRVTVLFRLSPNVAENEIYRTRVINKSTDKGKDRSLKISARHTQDFEAPFTLKVLAILT